MIDDHLISLQPGTVIGGKYEVSKCLGMGSMGHVYACRDRLLSQMVAVKVLFPDVARDKVAAARFRNEVLASRNVSHPNVVRTYDYFTDGDLVAYSMEYIGGGDLAERLGKRELMAIPEVVRVLSQMAAGVQAIHDAGIVHRDLKPENVFLTKEVSVKIGDFGIARAQFGPKLTEHGGVVGTIDYVAPEYMLKSQVDWRSDIYAIGILAYEMLVGESPFKGDSVYATMTKRLRTDPDPPSALRSECPHELDRVVLKAMEREPHNRYQSAMEMFFELQRLAVDKGYQGAIPGGWFLPSSGGSNGYVGPSVSAPVETASDGSTQPGRNSVSGELGERNGSGPGVGDGARGDGLGVSGGRPWHEPPAASATAARVSNAVAPSVSEQEPEVTTEVLSPQGVGDMVEYSERIEREAQRLGPVLDESSQQSNQWGRAAATAPQHGAISSKMRDRSQQAFEYEEKVERWKLTAMYVAAAVLGCCGGYYILKALAPEL